MKNKLPEVGKRYKNRYKNINGAETWICTNVKIERTPNGKRRAVLEQETGNLGQEFDLKRDFFSVFEELPEDNSQKEPDPFKFKPDTSFKFTAPRKVYRVDLSSLRGDSNESYTINGIESLTWHAPVDGLYTINGKEIRLKAGDPIKSAKYSVEPDNQEEPIWVLGSA